MANLITTILSKFLGKKSDRDIKEVTPYIEQINTVYNSIQSVSNDELRGKTAVLKKTIDENNQSLQSKIDVLKTKIETEEDANLKEQHYEEIDELEKNIVLKTEETLKQILPEAFAIIKETSRRFAENQEIEVTATSRDRELAALERDYVEIDGEKAIYFNSWEAAGSEVKWEMVHYDVQLIGGAILHQGKIAEMATGEGKTLVATLPVFLNALSGKGVHLVTVNDYLAKRDSEWMTPIFEFHGISVDCIDKHQPNSPQRRQAYLADVTYGTNNEFGFDYLRDNMARSPEDLVQRKHNYAIVDEVDSVLIDDARTPLIISGPTPQGDKHEFFELKPKVEKLVAAQRKFLVTALGDAKKLLKDGNTEEGGVALLRCYRGLPRNKALIKFLSEPGIKQQLQKTENFYMQDHSKEMHKVDAELYFTIEEKNNQVDLTEKGIELISDTADKDFFVLPDIGETIAEIEKSGASDTEKMTQKNTLMAETSVKGERVHTLSQLLKAYTVFEKDTEYLVMNSKVKIVDEQTGRIMEGRRYSDGLHQAIEAKENVKIEAATQTYATVTLQNYFRMYNKLSGMTGTAVTEEGEFFEIYKLDVVEIPTNRPIARDDRDDFVFKTTREKYNAVIDEIVTLKEAGRPTLVGTTSVEISELLGRMLKMKGIKHNVLNAKQHQREAQVVAEAGNAGMVTIATNMAGRGTDIKLTDEVKQNGGLAIVGTERHESRRVDRQLRGRAGRQGDPGSSQFYVSLEDNLMRLFGSDRIAKLMDRMGLEEGEVIQHGMISKSIERAQKKVEENNFGVRKNLLEYDDIMNSQREVIYSKRRHALYGERLGVDIAHMIYDVCEDIATSGYETFNDFKLELIRQFAIDTPVSEEEFGTLKPEDLTDKIYAAAASQYRLKKEIIAKNVFPIVEDVYNNQANQYQNMIFPFTDGATVVEIISNLENGFTSKGRSINTDIEKNIILSKIDDAWKEHLREMDDLRQSVQNARFEQKDPLLIYKFESFELFKQMLVRVNSEIVSFLLKANLPIQQKPEVQQTNDVSHTDLSNTQVSRSQLPEFMTSNQTSTGEAPPTGGEQKTHQPIKVEKTVGRNDPCPCGSGKKYKQCHGKPV